MGIILWAQFRAEACRPPGSHERADSGDKDSAGAASQRLGQDSWKTREREGVREDLETMSLGDRNIRDTGDRNTWEDGGRQVIGSGCWKFEVGMFSWKHRSGLL